MSSLVEAQAQPQDGHRADGTAPTFSIARFSRATDNQPQAAELTWHELAELLTRHDHRPNKDGALFSPTLYEAGATRGKAGVLFVSCLVLDFDNGVATGALKAKWNAAGHSYALHSSHSSAPDFPKWRAIFPLTAPVPGEEWPRVWAKLAASIGGGFVDASCKDASRIYYLPSCPPENADHAFAEIRDGAALDVATVPDLPDAAPFHEKPQRPPIITPAPFFGENDRYRDRAINDELATLCTAPDGTRHATLNKTAFRFGQFSGAGRYARSDAEYELLNAALSIGFTAVAAQRTIRDGLDAGEREPEYSGLAPDGHHSNGASNGGTFHRAATAYDIAPAIAAPRNGQVLPIRPDTGLRAPAFEIFSFKDLAKMPRPQWLIRGVLVESVASVLSADSGSYKSFVALDMALSIATGRAWQGREVKQGGAVYVAAEGFYTMLDRATAWAQFHGCELPENFGILKVPVNLANAGDVAAFQQSIEALKPAIVILDTLSQCAIGANENDNSHMADFVRGMMKLGNAIGAHVQVLHHNAKASGAFRGAGAIKANADSHITLDRPDGDDQNTVFVRCEKQRGKPFEAFALRGQEIELPDADEYGDPITTLVFEECGEEVTEKKAMHASTERSSKTRAALLEVFDKVAIEAEQFGGGVKIGFWRAAVEEANPPICSTQSFWRYRKSLEESDKAIEKYGTHNGSELYRRKAPTLSTLSTLSMQSESTESGAQSQSTHAQISTLSTLTTLRGESTESESESANDKKRTESTESNFLPGMPTPQQQNRAAQSEPYNAPDDELII